MPQAAGKNTLFYTNPWLLKANRMKLRWPDLNQSLRLGEWDLRAPLGELVYKDRPVGAIWQDGGEVVSLDVPLDLLDGFEELEHH